MALRAMRSSTFSKHRGSGKKRSRIMSRRETESLAILKTRLFGDFANDEQQPTLTGKSPSCFKSTRRLLAWGVLGLATGGCLFSLLTLLFSGALRVQTQSRRKSFEGFFFFPVFR